MKSRKTAAEAAFVRQAMEEDGAAMCAFYAWLEPALLAEYRRLEALHQLLRERFPRTACLARRRLDDLSHGMKRKFGIIQALTQINVGFGGGAKWLEAVTDAEQGIHGAGRRRTRCAR